MYVLNIAILDISGHEIGEIGCYKMSKINWTASSPPQILKNVQKNYDLSLVMSSLSLISIGPKNCQPLSEF